MCPVPDLVNHCKFISGFASSGMGLSDGFSEQQRCVNNATLRELLGGTANDSQSCYKSPVTDALFAKYAAGYSVHGVHAAFGFGDNSFTSQPNRSSIAHYYGGFIGQNADHFGYTVPPEIADPNYAIRHGNCFVDAVNDKPGYSLFSFNSTTILYGAGFTILDKDGQIVRQYAASSATQGENAAGYERFYPYDIPDVSHGKVANASREYLHASEDSNVNRVVELYSADAKLIFYNQAVTGSDGYPELRVFHGTDEIRKFFDAFFAFNDSSVAHAKFLLRFAEEANSTEKVPGNAFFTYRLGEGTVGQTFVFTDDGKIYGTGVVANVEGLSFECSVGDCGETMISHSYSVSSLISWCLKGIILSSILAVSV